ncbi:integrase/recombinase xerD homolog [Hyla sarda]|uniref:integrase/recombinase xerD homolog n=1 Tax=Hyla sarda TaxID=327740 RepID=UPI0024C3BB89|nr:integrase/recombinase xerD homolog [Hyla sarda]
MVDDPTMVPSNLGDDYRFSSNSTSTSFNFIESCGGTSSSHNVQSTYSCGLARLGDSNSNPGFSTRDILSDAWAQGTKSAYRSAWKLWYDWCSRQSVDPIHAPLNYILNYLSMSFEIGKAYRKINVYRSAISSYHAPILSVPISKHPLVCKLMKGIKFRRPPMPKYSSTWDVNALLDLFLSWEDNDSLSLQHLSFKLTVLLCLISFKRTSDVKALDLSRRQFYPNGVQFTVYRRTKTNIHSVFYPAFPQQQKLCVVHCLKSYEQRTQHIRNPSFPQLLISFRKPFMPVSSPTLARWIRQTMSMAGIDISLFGAHSTRGAMSTKVCQAGGSLSDIMKAANWSTY